MELKGFILQQLNKYLNNPFVVDLRALAMMRIGVGLLLLADLWLRAPDVVAWLTDSGVLPRDFWSESSVNIRSFKRRLPNYKKKCDNSKILNNK